MNKIWPAIVALFGIIYVGFQAYHLGEMDSKHFYEVKYQKDHDDLITKIDEIADKKMSILAIKKWENGIALLNIWDWALEKKGNHTLFATVASLDLKDETFNRIELIMTFTVVLTKKIDDPKKILWEKTIKKFEEIHKGEFAIVKVPVTNDIYVGFRIEQTKTLILVPIEDHTFRIDGEEIVQKAGYAKRADELLPILRKVAKSIKW